MQNFIYTILPLVIPLICIISLSTFFAICFKKKITETFFLSAATIIVILFFSGLLNFKGSLLLGYGIIIAFSIFSLVFLINSHIKNKNILNEISLIQGISIFLCFLIISLYLNYGRMFINWDEFSHWGSIVKNMFFFDALGTYREASGHIVKTYLEGSSLFQYFWMRPFSKYIEYPAYVASNMLYFSIVCTFIKKINSRNLLFIGTSLLLPLLIGADFYSSLYVDSIVGIFLGATFLFYHYYKYENSLFGIIIVLASTTLLSLIKDIGFVYSLVAIGIFVVDTLVYKKSSIQEYLKKEKYGIWEKVQYTFLLISPLFSTVLIQIVWKLNIKFTNIDTGETVVSKGISIVREKLYDLVNGNLEPYQLQVIKLYINELTSKPLSYLGIILGSFVITILFSLLFRKKSLSPKRLILNFALLIAGSLSIVFVLLITYLFVFSEYEALNLLSYGRYILSYLIAIFFSFLLFIVLEPSKQSQSHFKKNPFLNKVIEIIKYCSIFILFFALIYKTKDPISSEIINARRSVNSTIESRKFYDQILDWTSLIPEEKEGRTYVIAQQDKGFSKLIIIYNLLPTRMSWVTDYSVSTEPYYPEYPWTKIIDPNDWGEYVLTNYDLLYILNYDEKFVSLYGHFFDQVNSNSLYSVTTNEDGILRLISINKP